MSQNSINQKMYIAYAPQFLNCVNVSFDSWLKTRRKKKIPAEGIGLGK